MENILEGIIIGVGASLTWAVFQFSGSRIQNWYIEKALRNSIVENSGGGGADYRTGEFGIMIKNASAFDMVVREVNLRAKNESGKLKAFPCKHSSRPELGQFVRIVIPPMWGELWYSSLKAGTYIESGYLTLEINGFWGGRVMTQYEFTSQQLEQIRIWQKSSSVGRERLRSLVENT